LIDAVITQAVLAKQMPDDEKRSRADFVIDTSTSLEQTEAHVAAVLADINARLSGGSASGG
jgi:dephospho-CoA kinase